MEAPITMDEQIKRHAEYRTRRHFSKVGSSWSDYDHIRMQQQDKHAYLFIEKISSNSRPTTTHFGKEYASRAKTSREDASIYEEIPDKTRSKCSRFSLLVSILQFGVIAVCVSLLSIYVVKMEVLQKQVSSLNPCNSHLCERIRNNSGEFMTYEDGCSVQFVLQAIQPENLVEPNSKHHLIKGWTESSKKFKSHEVCLKLNSDSHFTVNKEGTYLFFSQLSFFATGEMLKVAFKKHLFVGQKVLSGGRQLLQQSSLVNVPQLEKGQPMPGCGDGKGALHVSTLTGIIDLEAGQNLSVYAIPIVWLCRDNDASFFGFFRIS